MTVAVKKPLIVDLKRNSLDDGPGIRTTVFFKGCPLSCLWCQNPETKSSAQQLVFDSESCILCGECISTCRRQALRARPDGRYPVNREQCSLCGDCIEACIPKALHFAGADYSVDELCRKLLADEIFYKNSGGGVTFSGGEPTLHLDYLARLAARLKESGIHICLETCGMYDRKRFETELLMFLDLVYFDIKLYDAEKHKTYCGAANDAILQNFAALFRSGAVKVVPRIPLIPGITMDEDNLLSIQSFLRNLGVKEIGLLPYNPTWLSKPETIGVDPAYSHADWMKESEKDRVKTVFRDFSFKNF